MDASDYMAARRARLLAKEAEDISNNPVGSKAVRPYGRPRMLAGMHKAARMSTARTADVQQIASDSGPVVETATPCCALPSPSPNTDVPTSNQYMHRELPRIDDCERIYREQMARPCHKGDGGLFVARNDVTDPNNPKTHSAGLHTVAVREIIEAQRPTYADILLPVVSETPGPCPTPLTSGNYYEPSLKSGRLGQCGPYRPSLN